MSQRNEFDASKVTAQIIADVRALPDRKTATVRDLRRRHSKRLATAPPRAIVPISLTLLGESDFLFRFIAYELITHHRAAMRSLSAKDLKRLGRGIDSWYAVDAFALYLSGPAWREKQVPDRLVRAWARSPDRWWRRAALVSTVPLNTKSRGGRGDAIRTLALCRMLLSDLDDMVVKAMSWALRELAKRDPASVRQFVAEHKKVLAKRVLREVRNKLKTGLKNPRAKRIA
jgi:3-methyladenine DNA glycosylase AlkD